MAVVGPAARDLFESFRLYWNEDLSKPEKLEELPKNLPPNTQTSGEDDVAKVQVVRTLSNKRFDVLKEKESEKGILEATCERLLQLSITFIWRTSISPIQSLRTLWLRR